MESNIGFVQDSFCFLSFIFYSILFFVFDRNHLRGQDILFIDVFDEDTIKDQTIGSLQIDLRPLYEQGFR